MADFEDAAKLESDKLSRRLVENAAMEAQLVSKVLADEAQFREDRRASLKASYGGALKKAKQEGEAAKQPPKPPARWEDVDPLAPDEEDAVKDVPETEAEIAAKGRLRAALTTALRTGQAVVRIRATLERRAAFAAPYAGAAKTAKQEGSAASPARGSAASPARGSAASPAKAASPPKARRRLATLTL